VQVVTESLLSLMLLDDVTIKDGFQKFLSMRKEALYSTVEFSKSKLVNERQAKAHIIQQLHDAIELIKQVIIQVYSIYILQINGSRSATLDASKDIELGDNLIATYVRQLQRNFSIQAISDVDQTQLQNLGIGLPASCSQPAISRIYSPNTNVHLLVRYLPESIQKYTPYININGEDGEGMRLQSVRDEMNHWLTGATDFLRDRIAHLLAECPDIQTLLDVRQTVWENLLEDELATNNPSSLAADHHIWSTACRPLFGKPLSLWHTILKSPFNQQLEELINDRTDIIKDQAQVLSLYLSTYSKDHSNGK
jgi:hypothetical protein